MSPKEQIESALYEIHRASYEGNPGEHAVITSWVVAYEFSAVVDDGEGSIVAYANEVVTSDGSPNTHAHLAHWASRAVRDFIGNDNAEEDYS